LERAVKAEGSVEVWLNQLLSISRSSLNAIIREAYSRISEPDLSIIELVEECPAQVKLMFL